MSGDHSISREPAADDTTRSFTTARPGADATTAGAGQGTDPIAVGRRLGEYEVLERLGRGGMGVVFRARHARLDRLVALKVLPGERFADARAVARFEREMKA